MHHATEATGLSDAELQRLHREDVQTTTVVAWLITGIFSLGLVMYAAIAYLVIP